MAAPINLSYEWDVEEWDAPPSTPDAECLEHHHVETFAEAVATRARRTLQDPDRHFVIVLVRDDFRSCGGRSWAYLRRTGDGVEYLPPFFEEPSASGGYRTNGIKMPRRFFDEVANYFERSAK